MKINLSNNYVRLLHTDKHFSYFKNRNLYKSLVVLQLEMGLCIDEIIVR